MKTISQLFLAILLSLSILAPAIIEIVDIDFGVEISQNLADEESEKEGKNNLEELEEKKLIIESLEFGDAINITSLTENSYHYQEKSFDLIRSIILPPPEKA